MNLNRRWFLGGSLAAVTACIIPPTIKTVSRLILPRNTDKRILEVTFYTPDGGYLLVDRLRENICIGRIHLGVVGRGGILHYRFLDHPIIIPSNHLMKLDYKPLDINELHSSEPCTVHIIYQEREDEEWGKTFSQLHTVAVDGTVLSHSLIPD